jgi:hypothetical protein
MTGKRMLCSMILGEVSVMNAQSWGEPLHSSSTAGPSKPGLRIHQCPSSSCLSAILTFHREGRATKAGDEKTIKMNTLWEVKMSSPYELPEKEKCSPNHRVWGPLIPHLRLLRGWEGSLQHGMCRVLHEEWSTGFGFVG